MRNIKKIKKWCDKTKYMDKISQHVAKILIWENENWGRVYAMTTIPKHSNYMKHHINKQIPCRDTTRI